MHIGSLDSELRLRARELIAAGRLPVHRRFRTYGGYGMDDVCSLCERLIERTELEYEVESASEAGVRIFRFHLVCHAAWQSAQSAAAADETTSL